MEEDYGADEVEQLWKTAVNEYQRKTGKSLKRMEPMDVAKMNQLLNVSFSGHGESGDIVKKCLTRVFQLGDLAAKTASEVYFSSCPNDQI